MLWPGGLTNALDATITDNPSSLNLPAYSLKAAKTGPLGVTYSASHQCTVLLLYTSAVLMYLLFLDAHSTEECRLGLLGF